MRRPEIIETLESYRSRSVFEQWAAEMLAKARDKELAKSNTL